MGRDLSDILNKIFSAYFTFEMVVKVTALGFCIGPHTFLSDAANWLDAFVVAIGIMDFIPPDPNAEGGGSLGALRALRVLRPLRAVNRFPALKKLVILLGKCVSKLGTVVGITMFIFLVFGILGVQLYKGGSQPDDSCVSIPALLLRTIPCIAMLAECCVSVAYRCTPRALLQHRNGRSWGWPMLPWPNRLGKP